MQYHEEGDLDKLLLENRNLSFDEKGSILRQILLGLEFLHEQHPKGIIHRDLKPKNIMMARNHNKYVPKITDFGISQWIGSGKRQVSEIGGTLLSFFHDSPERIQGGKNSNIRRNTDLWSFGVIAYQALTGELPFNTGGLPIRKEVGRQEVSRQITKGNLPDGINRIEQPWQGLIRRCLEKDPEKRIQSARECLELIG
jgi:serine/threonine-protein kinase